MPTGMNSRENLKKGRATQFGANGDRTAKAAGKRSAEVRRELRAFAEDMREIATPERRYELAEKLLRNMPKSPEWFKLGLRVLGELPPEQMQVQTAALSEAAKADLDRLLAETKGEIY